MLYSVLSSILIHIKRICEWNKKEIEKNCFAHIYLKPYDQLDEKTKDNDRMIMKYLWRINKPLAE